MVSLLSVGVVMNWRNERNKSGLYPVHIRVKQGNVARYYRVPVPMKVRIDQWSGKEGAWVKSSHPYAFEINSKVLEVKGQVNEYIKRMLNFGKFVTVEGVITSLNNKGENKSFLDFMQRFIIRPPERLEPNTIKKYSTTLSHLQKFKKQIYFGEIDNKFLRDFTRYMQFELKLGGGATKKYLESLKKVIRQARVEDYISPQQMEFLFDGLKIRLQKPKRTFLDLQEVKKWKALQFNYNQQHLERDRDLFLFQVYTGYYYKDLLSFTRDHLLEDEEYGQIILGVRDKNGNQTIIPLFKFPYAMKIIKKYGAPSDERLVFDWIIR